MEFVAVDLEGSGSQDREHEAILEIAVVPLVGRRPDLAAAYSSVVNPGRLIAPRPWISPGLAGSALLQAPAAATVLARAVPMLHGRVIVGHNVDVDRRLLQRHCPQLEPAGIVDTLRLARAVDRRAENRLEALIARYELTERVNELTPGSRPHRALWDTVAAVLLLDVLAIRVLGPGYTDAQLIAAAGVGATLATSATGPAAVQGALF